MTVTPDVVVTYVDRDGEAQCMGLGEVDARAVVEGQPVRLPPSYAGQKHDPGYFWPATMRRHLVYESLPEPLVVVAG